MIMGQHVYNGSSTTTSSLNCKSKQQSKNVRAHKLVILKYNHTESVKSIRCGSVSIYITIVTISTVMNVRCW